MKNDKKLTQRQIDIVALMQDGYVFISDRSESTDRIYFMVTKGFERVYFRADTFSRLVQNDLIYQQNHHPFNWELTPKAKAMKFDNIKIK